LALGVEGLACINILDKYGYFVVIGGSTEEGGVLQRRNVVSVMFYL